MSIKPLENANISWQQNTPFSHQFQDIYFSTDDGQAESCYVFLQQNHLAERFQQLTSSHFTIAETGFGTGLNFLNTWQLWKQHHKPNQKLYFISCELYPLRQLDLQQTLAQWGNLAALSQELLANYPLTLQGIHCLELSDNVTLILIFDDAYQGFQQLLENHHASFSYQAERAVDAWFLDGFAPQKNQGMWQDTLFLLMAKLSKKGTTLSTFSAAGFVKRGLQAAGFEVTKVTGFGKKRDMLCAQYIGLPQATNDCTSHKRHSRYGHFWPIFRNPHKAASVCIIGAGIAGCTTAYYLAQAGLQVTLLDNDLSPMQQASGNPQAVLFPRFSLANHLLAQWHLSSFLYAVRFYQQANFCAAFHQTGLLQLLNSRINAQLKNLALPELVQFCDKQKASIIANTHIQHDALFYPLSGWIETQKLAEQFLAQQSIRFIGGQNVTGISYQQQQWHINTANKQFNADAVVLANASAVNTLLADALPIKTTRGQITGFSAQQHLDCVVSYDGYICPSVNSQFVCGASFDLTNNNSQPESQSDDENRQLLAQYLDAFSTTDVNYQRVNFRCSTTDYFPIVGSIPDKSFFLSHYQNYRANAKAMIAIAGEYQKGLFVNIGHGSRGFGSVPLAAAIIRSYLLNQAYPCAFAMLEAMHPARFLIQQIARKKPS